MRRRVGQPGEVALPRRDGRADRRAGARPGRGLIAFVAAHALEYVVVVDRTLRSRYADAAPSRAASVQPAVGAGRHPQAADCPAGRILRDVRRRRPAAARRAAANVYLVVVYTIGLLHFLYDGFIWKTRRPAVAADFGVRPPARP